MVRGVSRRVIVVKNPDPKIFEQAIFIIREDFFDKSGMGADHVVRQAQKVADSYIRSTTGRTGRLLSRLPAPFFAAAGAVAAGVAWLALRLVGVG